jgi:pimeloyl-ACP methyl ester carboxylesterase
MRSRPSAIFQTHWLAIGFESHRFMIRILILGVLAVLALALFAAAIFTAIMAPRIERRFPPIGEFVTVGGVKLHVVDEGPRDAPAVLLIHGASSNARDMLGPMLPALSGQFRVIAIDRPGHGWSERGNDRVTGNATPDGQARMLASALDELGITQAVIFGHSFGAAVAAAMAVERPDKVKGLVLAAPVSHPWPSGKTNWYNHLAATPIVGWLFTRTLALPAGQGRLQPATDCVFAPNRQPDNYLEQTAIALVLEPKRFRANSIDLAGLHAYVTRYNPRYKEITAPTIIIAGGKDTVVSRIIHAEALRNDIAGSRLIEIANVGHKPDYALTSLIAAAVEDAWGKQQDLDGLAAEAADLVANDAFGVAADCKPYDPPLNDAFVVR